VRAWKLALVTAVACAAVAVAPSGLAATSATVQEQRVAALAAPAAPDVVLINQPVSSLCAGQKFTVGVWYQAFSGGSRAYRISIWGPRHIRFFYRHGLASSKHWRFWKVTAGRRGLYRAVYSGHRPGSANWSRYQVIVHARRCSRR
jgi:hypothetical protein